MDNINWLALGGIILVAAAIYFLFYHVGSRLGTGPAPGLEKLPTLRAFSTNFSELAKNGKIDPVIGREEEIRKLTQVLIRRGKNNAILVGDPGVGKTAIVEGLALRIKDKAVPEVLQNKTVLGLEVAKLLSDTKYLGEFEKRIRKVMEEVTLANRSIILFIDEIHSIVQSHGTEGSVNFADILKPALARGDLQMIGATTTEEYDKYVATNPSLARRFQSIIVREPSIEESIVILQGVKDKYRDYHRVDFTDAALETAVRLTHDLVKDRQLPDKAIDAIDEAAARIKVSHVHELVPEILHEAAIKAHPEVAKIWKKIQDLDKQVETIKNGGTTDKLKDEREQLQKPVSEKGLVIIDSDDIRRVVEGWC